MATKILRTIWIAHTNYHAQMDMDALLIGESYDRLPDTYVIFICDFDPFGDQLYRYTARNMIYETNKLLADGNHTIILSTKGKILMMYRYS